MLRFVNSLHVTPFDGTALATRCGMIWLAVCREKKCQWHRGARNKTTADVYAHLHRVGGHRVIVAAVPKGAQRQSTDARTLH